jgi:Zn-dependent peptidase ImmA (M78 family)
LLIQAKDVAFCLEKARELAGYYRQYVLAGDGRAKSVDDLLWICREYLKKNIQVAEVAVPAAGKVVRAVFIGREDGYDIYLLAGMDRVSRRFILCKELFHVILDQESSRSMDIYGHLEEVTATFPVPSAEPRCPAAWEVLAEAAAMEFLYPYAERKVLDMSSASNGEIDAIAATYDIPRYLVESYCADQAMTYFDQFKET